MKRTVIPFLITLITLNYLSVMSNCENTRTTEEVFNDKYNNWKDWKNDPAPKAISIYPLTTGIYWDAIIDIGPEALPFIVNKMKEDPDLAAAFSQISRIRPIKERIIIPKKINMNELWVPERDYYLSWWNEDRKHLDKDIRKDISTYKELRMTKKPQEELNEITTHMRENYGIFSMPFILPEIEKGNYDFVPIAWDLLDTIESDKEKNNKFKLEIKDKVKTPKERSAIIIEVTSRNHERIKAIEDLIPEYQNDKANDKNK